jgi:hypothetical protein
MFWCLLLQSSASNIPEAHGRAPKLPAEGGGLDGKVISECLASHPSPWRRTQYGAISLGKEVVLKSC